MGKQIEPPGYHLVMPGETLPSIARTYGFADANIVWNDPKNAPARLDRSSKILFAGDRLWIPAPPGAVSPPTTGGSGGGVTVMAGSSATLKANTDHLTITLQDNNNSPQGNVSFHLDVGSNRLLDAKTAADGQIKAGLPVPKASAVLALEGVVVRVKIGELPSLEEKEPAKQVAAVQARLNNLGLRAGAEDGVLGSRTKRAIQLFQKLEKMPEDGKISHALLDKLKQRHGG